MSALELHRDIPDLRIRYDLLGTLRAGWTAARRHREERRTLVELSRKPPHVLRDMGIDPEHVYAALDGTWDETDPEGYRSHLPRTERI